MDHPRAGWARTLGTAFGCAIAGACTGGQGYDDGSDPITLGDGPITLGAGGMSAGGNSARPMEITAEQFARAITTTSQDVPDTTGGAWRVFEVPTLGGTPSLVETPLGFLALSSRSVGDARAPSGYDNVLLLSVNGNLWQSTGVDVGSDVRLSQIAYGNGRYVMLGRTGAGGVVFSSPDLHSWTEVAQPVSDSAFNWGRITFAGEYFFAMGFRELGTSRDGQQWTTTTIDNVQPTAVAFGNDRYVLAGSGPMEVSDDGTSWMPVDVDCDLPGACITDPSGNVGQSIQYHVLFAEGRFYSDQISSSDGIEWRAEPERVPARYVGGRFLGELQASPWGLPTWRSSGDVEWLSAVRPDEDSVRESGRALEAIGALDGAVPDGVGRGGFYDRLDCTSATCVVVGNRLLLVPPVDAAPLPDWVPRRDDGTPLLEDECPVSSMISCDDYDARAGCTCNPEAPRNPSYCQDVSHYQCEGQFETKPGEWELDEVREGGCDCNGSDPNQPATLGEPCTSGDDTCEAPFECLGIDAPASAGPPAPQPFVCTMECLRDDDCPTWEATGFCAGPVALLCSHRTCQPRACDE